MKPSKHVLIGGTGRAGTTLLVQFFSALGLDTGFTPEQALHEVDPFSKAGLERWLSEERRPYIIKNPRLVDEIEEALNSGEISIDAAIIPMRDLFSAAESRREVYRGAEKRGAAALAQPGTLWKTTKAHKQEAVLAVQFYRFLHPLVRHQVPIYFLDFPRFAGDPDYLIQSLAPFLKQQGVGDDAARRALLQAARPELISDFTRRQTPPRTQRGWRGWLARRP